MKVLVVISLTLISFSSYAQDIMSFFSPDAPSTMMELEGMHFPHSEIEHSGKDTDVTFQSLDISQRVYNGENDKVSVGARYQKLDLASSSPLDDFYNQQVSINHKHLLKDDRFLLSNVSFGSASDRPFKNSRDNTLSANVIHKFNNKWFGVINYSNNRSFLNNIPLPGAFYVARAEKTESLIIGFPFIFWMTRFSDNWSLRYIGLMPWSHRLRIFFEHWKDVRPYVGIEQHPQNYFRHDRDDKYDRLFWFERRLTAGVEGNLLQNLKYDVSSGYAFDRQFFEARNFSEKKEFLINMEPSWFIGLNLRLRL